MHVYDVIFPRMMNAILGQIVKIHCNLFYKRQLKIFVCLLCLIILIKISHFDYCPALRLLFYQDLNQLHY